MRVTIESYGITATIESKSDDLTLSECMEDIIIPALIASGYQKESIDEWLDRPAAECDCGCNDRKTEGDWQDD